MVHEALLFKARRIASTMTLIDTILTVTGTDRPEAAVSNDAARAGSLEPERRSWIASCQSWKSDALMRWYDEQKERMGGEGEGCAHPEQEALPVEQPNVGGLW